jgi:hypothetical protein
VVDLDTGGGERFLELRESWPDKVVATENYPPNFKLATERLTPFGAKVVNALPSDDAPIPFADGEFDVVLNRHAAFNAAEVARGYGNRRIPGPPERLIVLGFTREELAQFFETCSLAGQVPNPYGVLNEETKFHPHIFVCEGLRMPWDVFWERMRVFG